MAKTLAEVRQLYPLAGYAPDAGCAKCHGNGDYDFKGRPQPCACIFFGPDTAEVMGLLGPWAAKVRGEVPSDGPA